MLKRVLFVVLVLVVVMQFIRPKQNVSGQPAGKDDFVVMFSPPPAVREVLHRACYDCHSDNTRYPWYANVQPVGWWLADHVNEGKEHLNFSRFGPYSLVKQSKKLDDCSEQIGEREMPMPSYTWLHREARLTDAQIETVTAWLDGLNDRLAPLQAGTAQPGEHE